MTEEPFPTDMLLHVHALAGPTLHDDAAKLPESAPSVHVRCSLTHWEPKETDADWYAVADCPWGILWPLRAHDAAAVAEQELY